MNHHDANSPQEIDPTAQEGPHIQVLAAEKVVKTKSLWDFLGPGFVTGASDDDPSGIGTYAAAGAAFGFATLWMAWVSFPLMAGVQVICARIGQVSGRGLSGVLAKFYPRPVVLFTLILLLVANTVNAGADIGAIAAAINLLVPAAPILWLIVPVTVIILAFEIYGSYAFIERTFKWLALALLAYIASAFLAHPDWSAVARATVMPTIHWNGKFIATVVAILGTTISPYLFFWQASEEIELEKAQGLRSVHLRKGATDEQLRERAVDVNFGMGFSNLVMYFIILATAATLFKAGHTEINSATEAAQALRPIAGVWASQLFAVGLIGTGLLAVPILTCSSAFAIAEAFAWRFGLDQKLHSAKRFYAVIVASMIIGMAMNYIGINPMAALFWTAVINGVLAPPLLVIIMLVSNNREVMGDRVNGPVLNILGWGATLVMTVAAIAMFATWGQ